MSEPLPLLTQSAPERRDAARNRERLLAAAAELIDNCDVSSLTMEAVAAKAGVGKGTVFRRFGSREGLMASLLDHSEREWQAAVISGPPPVGPGAPPMQRLLAFGESRLRTTLQQAALIDAAGRTWETNYAVLGFVSIHVRHLLTQLGVRGDVGYLATALVAPLGLPVVRQQLESDRMSVDQVVAGWSDLVRRVVG
jgi:AcrR family transcriptional regulator